jgi:hypothetical protein
MEEEPRVDPGALGAAIGSARGVRVVKGGGYEEKHREQNETLFLENDPDAIAALRLALRVEPSEEGYSWMTPGDPTMAIYGEGHELLAVVTYLHPGFVRWQGWDADLPLKDRTAVTEWLAERGWRPPK